MSAESRLIQALEEMNREYSKNPSKALKHRIDYNRDRLHRMQALKIKKKKTKTA
jgi:hypothetical protein